MGKKQLGPALTFEQLHDGYGKTITNGIELLGAAITLHAGYPERALGLAQIGQEEIGKSLSILAGFYLPKPFADWDWFWSGWRDHGLKAHRAFLYELIYPARIEITAPDGQVHSGGTLRQKIQHEKEYSLYVDYDAAAKQFIAPKQQISIVEPFNRATACLSMGTTAFYAKAGLDKGDLEFNYRSFSEIALRICSENLYQQDMPTVFTEFRSRSSQHETLMVRLTESLEEGGRFMRDC